MAKGGGGNASTTYTNARVTAVGRINSPGLIALINARHYDCEQRDTTIGIIGKKSIRNCTTIVPFIRRIY